MAEESLAEEVLGIGYRFCSSPEECRNHLLWLLNGRELTPVLVAEVLSIMVCKTSGIEQNTLPMFGLYLGLQENPANHPTRWDVEVFVNTVNQMVPSMSWTGVLHNLDNKYFYVKDKEGLEILIRALRIATNDYKAYSGYFPSDLLYRDWENMYAQFSLVRQMVLSPDVFCFGDHSIHHVEVDMLHYPPDTGNIVIKTWMSLDLMEILMSFSNRGLYNEVKDLLEIPMNACPDLLILAFVQLKPPLINIQFDILNKLMPMFVGSHPNSVSIFQYILNSQNFSARNALFNIIYQWYVASEKDRKYLHLIIDSAVNSKALDLLLSQKHYPFILDIACLAAWKKYLELEPWLFKKIRNGGPDFIIACINFLELRCPYLAGKEVTQDPRHPVPPEMVTCMLTCLLHSARDGYILFLEKILKLLTTHNRMLREMQQLPPSGVIKMMRCYTPVDATMVLTELSQNVPAEYEHEINFYFKYLLDASPSEETLEQLFDMLGRFRVSESMREREVYNCMMRKLYKDYPIYSNYPRHLVLIFSQIVGGVIQRGLTRGRNDVNVFLGLIIDGLEHPTASKLNDFGIFALDKIKTMLQHFPYFCHQVCAMHHCYEFPPILMKQVYAGLLPLQYQTPSQAPNQQ